MKKHGILNSSIAAVLTHLGHTDTIVVADCGLPIPDNVKKIDLSIKKGFPSFLDVLEEVAKDMVIEKATLAAEIQDQNQPLYTDLKKLFTGTELAMIKHEDFKKQTAEAKAVIRTGEVTPYANVILHAGVIF
ncbi:D-ribose pyranase [Scopulibacillus daqui]|uniref:D-ribose pyranase n=1 Tax=Scopulibacillus daqui TaxID=1469162 RepID=A0ABS2Q3E3_9BACL|nr:D-ribose pyranase [Scopulibacillus daqui]MBM7646641.1 D-ribose pyranase [Scopulibacillus daqui]